MVAEKNRGINKYGWHIGLRITNCFFSVYTHADLIFKYSKITSDSTDSIWNKTIAMLVVVIMLHW